MLKEDECLFARPEKTGRAESGLGVFDVLDDLDGDFGELAISPMPARAAATILSDSVCGLIEAVDTVRSLRPLGFMY